MIFVGQFPDDDRILTIRAHVLSQAAPRRPARQMAAPMPHGPVQAARRAAEAQMQAWFGNDPPRGRFAATLPDTDSLLRHAAALQGLDSDLALLFGRWRHLPYWIESIWLPGDIAIRPFLFDRLEHGPFFIGSAKMLAAELDEIRQESTAGFGGCAVAAGMAEAGASADAIIHVQQAWQNYREAARLAMEMGLPMWTEL